MTSKSWHDTTPGGFIPAEIEYALDRDLGVGLCINDIETRINDFQLFLTREEAIKLRDNLTTYINRGLCRE